MSDDELGICGHCDKTFPIPPVAIICWGCWVRESNNEYCSQACFDAHFDAQGCRGTDEDEPYEEVSK